MTAITNAFTERSVNSFAVYDTTGLYDLLLRTWIPSLTTQNDFESCLRKHLAPLNLQRIDVFAVSEHIMHWVWDDGNGGIRIPSDETLQKQFQDSKLAKFNDGQFTEDQFVKARDVNLLEEMPFTDGVKFSIMIPPSETATYRASEAIEVRLCQILINAENVQEKSLYHGLGFAQFLIVGRVPYDHYFAIFDELVNPIVESGAHDFLGVRTYTQINAAKDFVAFQEQIPTRSELSLVSANITELLSQDESMLFEVKGSALVDLKRWLHSNEAKSVEPSRRITMDEFLKPIVGMLNAEGGHILIGAIEHERYPNISEKLKSYPTHGKFTCVGIELDTQKNDWDWYLRNLREYVTRHITPSCSFWVTIDKREVENVPVCLISINAPTDQYFYLVEDLKKPNNATFCVREDNSTRILGGVEADQYKRSRGRLR